MRSLRYLPIVLLALPSAACGGGAPPPVAPSRRAEAIQDADRLYRDDRTEVDSARVVINDPETLRLWWLRATAETPEPKPELKPKSEAKPKPAPKAEVKPKPKPTPSPTAAARRQMRQELAREEAAIQAQRQDAELRALLAREASARALASWTDKIRDKIRGNIILPPSISGNPEAIFDVVLLPTGDVLGTPRLRRTSGDPRYDDAVLRAILKSSPLPRPEDPKVFTRNLELRFRPQD